MNNKIVKYIPEKAVELVFNVLDTHPIPIKIVNERNTKHGDFRVKVNRTPQISINKNLNKYQFLLTLIHEIAHFITFKENKYAKPHGKEWKKNFQHLILPFLQPSIFPLELLPSLANHFKNPKASTATDTQLTYALKQYDEKSGKNFIFELQQGSKFEFNNKTFKKGKLRRTRIECVEVSTNKIYLFNQNAEVIIL